MHEIYLTVQGNLATDVTFRVTPTGAAMAQFRVASSSSRVDGSGQWRETGKAYFDVTCWRRAAENARASLAKGLPVVVFGRFRQRQVTRTVQGSPEATYEHTYNDLEAFSFGLDLSRCQAQFQRSQVGPQLTGLVPTGGAGELPAGGGGAQATGSGTGGPGDPKPSSAAESAPEAA